MMIPKPFKVRPQPSVEPLTCTSDRPETKNCASLYTSERIHLKTSDGTAIIAKWTFLSSVDASVRILAPKYLAGTKIAAPHIPYFAIVARNWYYEHDAITNKAYVALQKAAEQALEDRMKVEC